MPTEKLEGAWLHVGRLPLGRGWSGHCTAPGHEGEVPSTENLQEFCNLGYAGECGRLPIERAWDSIRFGARAVGNDEDSPAQCIQVRYVCERNHLPAEHGVLEFHILQANWQQRHPDSRVQRMAECFVAAYMEKRQKPNLERMAS